MINCLLHSKIKNNYCRKGKIKINIKRSLAYIHTPVKLQVDNNIMKIKYINYYNTIA